MSKFCGSVGYEDTVETRPGVWTEQTIEKTYYGDLIQNTSRMQSSDKLNDDVNVSNKISIVADPYANEKFHAMRYVVWMGAKWKINSVEVAYPRLVLTIGGLYNG